MTKSGILTNGDNVWHVNNCEFYENDKFGKNL